jgi:hypothetical protein
MIASPLIYAGNRDPPDGIVINGVLQVILLLIERRVCENGTLRSILLTLGDNRLSSNGCEMEGSQKYMACRGHATSAPGNRWQNGARGRNDSLPEPVVQVEV